MGAAGFSRTITVRPLGSLLRVTPAMSARTVAGSQRLRTATRPSVRRIIAPSWARTRSTRRRSSSRYFCAAAWICARVIVLRRFEIAQLVVQRGLDHRDAVGSGHAVGGLVHGGVVGLRLGDGELALLLGRAVLLQARDLLEDALLGLVHVGRFEPRLDVDDARRASARRCSWRPATPAARYRAASAPAVSSRCRPGSSRPGRARRCRHRPAAAPARPGRGRPAARAGRP